LRLFLKLVSQVEADPKKANFGLEPLPDIDFNIRAGNTLVGFVSLNQVCESIAKEASGQKRLIFDDGVLDRIIKGAVAADQEFKRFRSLQTQGEVNGEDLAWSKASVKEHLAVLREELDRFLAEEYEQGLSKRSAAYGKWKLSHQPFHWFVEFYGIINAGGFDVIIGNPPYVEYKNVRENYTIQGFETVKCSDLYAFTMERSTNLLNNSGKIGMIIPISIVSTDGFESLRDCLLKNNYVSWALNFAERPSKLFTGVEKRLTIWITHKNSNEMNLFLGSYKRWLSEERETLFSQLYFVGLDENCKLVSSSIPKISSNIEKGILARLAKNNKLSNFFVKDCQNILYYTRKLRYFVQFYDFIPTITDINNKILEPTELKEISFSSREERDVAIAILNSNLFFWFFNAYSDVRNVNKREIEEFRFSIDLVQNSVSSRLSQLKSELMIDFQKNSKNLTNNYGKSGILTIQSFQPRQSKHIIDEIDRVLAQHYGFTEEELDFIINYDIKYRMGKNSEEEE
jgi:hypothetical protein